MGRKIGVRCYGCYAEEEYCLCGEKQWQEHQIIFRLLSKKKLESEEFAKEI